MAPRRTYSVGDVVMNCEIIGFSHKVWFSENRTHVYYKTRCTNCGLVTAKVPGNLRIGGCRNCFLLPQGQAGCNMLMGRYRRAAKKANRFFSLTPEEFRRLTSSPCFYCGSPPECLVACNQGSASKRSTWGNYIYNGIDRIDHNLGYVTSNCVPCCFFCNRARNTDHFDKFASHMRDLCERIRGGMLPQVTSHRLQNN